MNSYKFNQKNSTCYTTTTEFEEDYLELCEDAKNGKINAEKKAKDDVVKSEKE